MLQLPAPELAKLTLPFFLFRTINTDTVTSAAFSWQMEAASYLVSFFAFHSPCCWPGVCGEKPHHYSLLPATFTLVDAVTHSHLHLPFAEVADTTLTIIYIILGPRGF